MQLEYLILEKKTNKKMRKGRVKTRDFCYSGHPETHADGKED